MAVWDICGGTTDGTYVTNGTYESRQQSGEPQTANC